MTMRTAVRAATTAAFLLGVVVGAAAQQNPSPGAQPAATGQSDPSRRSAGEAEANRAFRGLFGATDGRDGALSLQITIFQEYAQDPAAEPDGLPRSLAREPGLFMGVSSELAFVRRRPRGSIGLRADGNLRYYPVLQQYTRPRFSAAVDASAVLDRQQRSSLRVIEVVEYLPYYSLALYRPLATPLLDAIGPDAGRDDALADLGAYMSDSQVTYAYQVTPRISLALESGLRVTQSGNPAFDARDLRGRLGVSRRFTPHLAVQAGYGYRRGELSGFSEMRRLEAHEIDLGIAFSRRISRSRKTSLSIVTGSTIVGAGPERSYRVIGSAGLRREFARRFSAQLAYDRGVQIVAGFADPLLSDAVIASVGGLVGRRLEVWTSGGYTFGRVGFGRVPYRQAQGDARVRYALSRYLAADAQYLYYQHDFAGGIPLLAAGSAAWQRHAGRVNLVVWLPLTNR